MKVFKSVILLLVLLLSLTACGSGEPSIYNAPKGAPYEGLYEIDRMNSSCSYSGSPGKNVFKVKMEWATKDDNIDHAEFSDEYYIEWTNDDMFPYDLYVPSDDMSALRSKTYTIKPGEDVEIIFDYDTYFEDIPQGFFKFIKVFDVYYKDGTTRQEVAAFSYEFD